MGAKISDPSSLAAELEKVDDITEINLVDLLAAPIVESASRRKQSLDDAAASVTQFEADQIATSGAISLADLFQQVPGVFVFERRSNSFDVGLRGNYRVLLLVDGRLVATLDDTPFWDTFYFHAGEIERIEVLRGPIDLDKPGAGNETLPLGGYPSLCFLLQASDIAMVTVSDELPAMEVDLQLYDEGGPADPCFQGF